MSTAHTEREGLHHIASLFESLGWNFRETSNTDIGIDADVEMPNKENGSSKHIALQIKSGPSYLKEKKNGLISYSIDKWHYEYWLKSDRPVLIVFYDKENSKVLWEHVCLSNLEKAKKNYIIEISPNKVIETNCIDELRNIISTHKPFEVYEVDKDCVNFEYSIHCTQEINKVLQDLADDLDYFRKQLNMQIDRMVSGIDTTLIITKLFSNTVSKFSLFRELFYENCCKSHWYLDELTRTLPKSLKDDLYAIIEKNKTTFVYNIQIWTQLYDDVQKVSSAPGLPSKLKQEAKKLQFELLESIALLRIIIDTQYTIQVKLKK